MRSPSDRSVVESKQLSNERGADSEIQIQKLKNTRNFDKTS